MDARWPHEVGHDGGNRAPGPVAQLRARSRICGLKSLAERDRLILSSREHAELLDLIESGDPMAPSSSCARHIGHVRGIWARDTRP